jgi:hypothetical protein
MALTVGADRMSPATLIARATKLAGSDAAAREHLAT